MAYAMPVMAEDEVSDVQRLLIAAGAGIVYAIFDGVLN
ncbi:hypothetical protein PCH70_00820 [Pseudomonas cichorii JBC1]|nr:hypothetical protein PCH70_00820 [Pseudomonas cichorii JBC1]